jgi:hypothetical protein
METFQQLLGREGAAAAEREFARYCSREGLAANTAWAVAESMPSWKWWAQIGIVAYPTLGKVAKWLLPRPTSSSPAEWNWSTFGFVHDRKRNRLTVARAAKLVYLYSNLRLVAAATSHKFQDQQIPWQYVDPSDEIATDDEEALDEEEERSDAISISDEGGASDEGEADEGEASDEGEAGADEGGASDEGEADEGEASDEGGASEGETSDEGEAPGGEEGGSLAAKRRMRLERNAKDRAALNKALEPAGGATRGRSKSSKGQRSRGKRTAAAAAAEAHRPDYHKRAEGKRAVKPRVL